MKELIPVAIEDEMKKSYLDYAMSVIVSRAIPDVRDGLKPVHRRILYSMYESGYEYNKPYKKSARIVGDVIGKYHPHGEAAIYDSLVRMAQSFSLRVPLIDGQGNFGSIDGDSPAAMRYTECRLEKITNYLLSDLDKETVNFKDNYDASEREPTVLPAIFPNLLVNGSGGIAVGMATNIPPHNLGEVIDAVVAYVDNNGITFDELAQIVKGPDFPTGASIIGLGGIRAALSTGRGSVVIRGKTEFEKIGNREAIVITEIPYQVNKAKLVERIAELVKDKKIEGISDLRDESNKIGMRVVIELKKDVNPEIMLNQLYSFTPLQSSFGYNMLALNEGRPETLNLLSIIKSFTKFREEVITKRSVYLLGKAKSRAHILIGLAIAVANIDEMIEMIKAAPDPNTARIRLLAKKWFAKDLQTMVTLVGDRINVVDENGYAELTEEQARAILDMKLQRLTGLETDRIANELDELAKEIQDLIEILNSRTRLLTVLKEELIMVRDQFATPRLTEILEGEFDQDLEDLIQKEDMMITVTLEGYIKRVPLVTYKAQRRGGKGRAAIKMKEEDITTDLFIATTHNPVLFFSNRGRVYKLKVYKLPLGNPQSKGRALVNLLPLAENEKITNVMVLPENEADWDNLNIVFATSSGNVRRNDFTDFHSIQSNGKIAMKLDEGDSLIGVALCKETDHVLLAAKSGKCVRFPVTGLRVFKSRSSSGVRGMKLAKEDAVISLSILHGAEMAMELRDSYLSIGIEDRINLKVTQDTEFADQIITTQNLSFTAKDLLKMAASEEYILTITENGFGKRSSAYEYRVTNRGGSGIVNIVTSGRNGGVVTSFPVDQNDEVMIITNEGTVLRSNVKDIRIQGRNTKGVTIKRTEENEKVVSVARIMERESEEEAGDEVE